MPKFDVTVAREVAENGETLVVVVLFIVLFVVWREYELLLVQCNANKSAAAIISGY